MKMISMITLSVLLGLSSLFGVDFTVDPTHSSLDFKVRHMMVSNTKGSFNDFTGTFSYDNKKRRLLALEGTVKVASINTEDVKRDKHLRSPEFFDVEKFPTMHMTFIKQDKDSVTVVLKIKDVTKHVVFEMDGASEIVKDPWGGKRTGFSLEGKIDRQDFNIKFSELMETGAIMVGDEVNLSLEIEGTQVK